jgi:hypothetical protein
VQGGSGAGYTWSIVDGEIPGGLSIDGRNEGLSWGDPILTGYVDYQATGLAAGDLTEISGLVASRLNPGVLWALDDSGNGPDLFALDEDGNLLQKYTIANATNRDWEDLTIGRGSNPDEEYLYVGDFGDNSSSRSNYQIVRVAEPIVPVERTGTISLTGAVFYFRYPDGPRNCEAMLMDWEDGIIYLIQKASGVGHVYKFPSGMAPSWDATHPVDLIQASGTGIVSGLITGASSSRDGERVLIRQYGNIWEYVRPAGAEFEDIFDEDPLPVDVGGATGQQYEAIAYSSDGTALYTSTEKAGSATIPIYRADADEGPLDTTISGTPSSAGTYTFTVQVKDSAGDVASREFTLDVD